jgi:hypothetical protein
MPATPTRSRALVATMIGLLVVLAFALTQINDPNPPEPASSGTICDPAPDVSFTLAGAFSGSNTKPCLPLRRPGPAAQPYCRLDHIPAKPGEDDGVVDANVAFALGGDRYDLQLTYRANASDSHNGRLPVTLTAGAGAQATLFQNATLISDGNVFNQMRGEYSLAADGASGTINMDFGSTTNQLVHLEGRWTVARGCPKAG